MVSALDLCVIYISSRDLARNALKIENETTHGLVCWRRVASMAYYRRKATGRRIVHHEEDGLDGGFVGEPPLLGLEVVAGSRLLVFGHRLWLCGWRCGLVCGWLCRSWLFLSRGDSASCGFAA